MGICTSKVVPHIDYTSFFNDMEMITRSLHNLYSVILRERMLTKTSFLKYLQLDKNLLGLRHKIEGFLHKEGYRQDSLEYKLNEFKFEQMNALLSFKSEVLQLLLQKEFIVSDDLLMDVEFKSFLSILPDMTRADSYNNFLQKEKSNSDTTAMEKIITSNEYVPDIKRKNKYDVCPHCGCNLTHHIPRV